MIPQPGLTVARSRKSVTAGRFTRCGPGAVAVQDLGAVGFQAVVVPSGFRTRVQPQRWMHIWWWKKHNRTQSRTLGLPPLALCLTWCTWQAEAGWLHFPAHWQCLSRRVTALRMLASEPCSEPPPTIVGPV